MSRRRTQIARAVPWTAEQVGAFIGQHSQQMQAIAGEVARARALGLSAEEATALKTEQARRAADLNGRVADFYRELRELVPPRLKVGEAVFPHEVEALARKNGVAIGAGGQFVLAEDVA